MRPIGKRFCLIALLLTATAVNAQSLPEPRTVRINDRVYALLGPVQHANKRNQGYMINSTVIVGERGVILVDSGGTRTVGQHIAKAIRRITPKPVTHVINTHPHGDHYLGNSAFPEAMIISSEKCRAAVKESGLDWVALMERLVGRQIPDTKPIAAAVTYREGSVTEVRLHGIPIILWVPPGSHTDGDLLVYLPRDKVLAAGDVVVNGIVPVMQDASVRNWIDTLAEIQTLEAETVVPGHGDLMTMREVRDLQQSIARFYAGVKRGVEKGLHETEIRETLDLADWEKLERAYVIGRNINRAYLEIEKASFDQ